MNGLHSRCARRNPLFVLAAVVALSLSLTVSVDAAVLFTDNFSGTSIDTTLWNILTPAGGPTGQFTENSGLFYQGSSSPDDQTIVADATLGANIQVTGQFSNFTSTTTFPSGYNGHHSGLDFGLGTAGGANQVDIGISADGHLWAGRINGSTGVWLEGPVLVPTTATGGQLSLLYDGSVVSAYYNIGGGWQLLGTFHPGWSGPVFTWITGHDMPNGTTSFEVTSFTVSGSPTISYNFTGTSIDTSAWYTYVLSGASGEFTENNGLLYRGSTGSDMELLTPYAGNFSVAVQGTVQETVQFSNFLTTSTNNPSGSNSGLNLGMGPAGGANQVDIGFIAGSFWAGRFNGSTGDFYEGPVGVPTTATGGQLSLLYDGTTVSAQYNVGQGWQVLRTFTPGWSGPQAIWLVGMDEPNGATSFKVTNFTVSGTSTPGSIPLSLTAAYSGSGSGTITSTPSGINCGSTCSASYDSGAAVTLAATPNPGSTFTGWSGACQNASGACVVDMYGAEEVTANYTFTGIDIPLSSGWNLVSLPLQQAANASTASVLSSIKSALEVVWAYPNQGWKVYDPNDAAGSTLKTMQAGMGYWIKMTNPKKLSVSGSAPSASLSLSSGWNLVGYNGTLCATALTALSGLTGLQVSWGYPGQAWQFYVPANSSNTLTQLCPNYGYWINVNQAGTWSGW